MARPLGSGPIQVYIGFGPPSAILVGTPPAPFAGSPPSVSVRGGVVTGTGGTLVYYGTTRSGVDTDENLDYYQVMNDLTGPKQSMDDGFAGREDNIALVMSSWTQAVDNALEQFLRPASAIPSALGVLDGQPVAGMGTDAVSDLGTLMVSEGKTVGLWLVKAAAGKAVNVASGLPVGRYYFTCTMIGPNKLVEGNKENLRVRVFKAKKNISALNTGNLPLFSENPSNFTAGMLSGTAAFFG